MCKNLTQYARGREGKFAKGGGSKRKVGDKVLATSVSP